MARCYGKWFIGAIFVFKNGSRVNYFTCLRVLQLLAHFATLWQTTNETRTVRIPSLLIGPAPFRFGDALGLTDRAVLTFSLPSSNTHNNSRRFQILNSFIFVHCNNLNVAQRQFKFLQKKTKMLEGGVKPCSLKKKSHYLWDGLMQTTLAWQTVSLRFLSPPPPGSNPFLPFQRLNVARATRIIELGSAYRCPI